MPHSAPRASAAPDPFQYTAQFTFTRSLMREARASRTTFPNEALIDAHQARRSDQLITHFGLTGQHPKPKDSARLAEAESRYTLERNPGEDPEVMHLSIFDHVHSWVRRDGQQGVITCEPYLHPKSTAIPRQTQPWRDAGWTVDMTAPSAYSGSSVLIVLISPLGFLA